MKLSTYNIKQLFKIITASGIPGKSVLGQGNWHPLRSLYTMEGGMDLGEVVNRLKNYASPSLAASWDNVGLLVEPSSPHSVSRLLLTNDLTQEVVEEAINKHANMILSYHPPIFQPLKRLTQKTWKERILVKCLEKSIAVYSPHTSYDVICHGINDWLIAPFASKSEPIIAFDSKNSASGDYSIAVNLSEELPEEIEMKLAAAIPDVALSRNKSLGLASDHNIRLGATCTEKALPQMVAHFEHMKHSTIEIVQLLKPPIPGYGYGRITTLESPISVQDSIELIKSHLKLPFIRLALGSRKTTADLIKTVAVCAGSGSTVLHGVKADLYVTGEMSHHEVLDATQNGITVVLCDHSNTERGFLTVLEQSLDVLFDHRIDIQVSSKDKDPLEIV